MSEYRSEKGAWVQISMLTEQSHQASTEHEAGESIDKLAPAAGVEVLVLFWWGHLR